jgi:hypothetical protein
MKYKSADAGGGWLIFALPLAEVAVHPSDENDVHELYFMVDDINGFIADMKKQKLTCGPVSEQPWGLLTQLTLPGGGKLGVYEPRHASPVIKTKKSAPKKRKAASKRKKKR